MPEISINIEYQGYEQTFSTKVVGVTYSNPDGVNRQDLLKRSKPGQPIKLFREPDNPKDKLAIAVYNRNGQQLGYLPHDPRLADHMDKGGPVTAKIKAVTGGPGCLGQFFGGKQKSYGCVIQITKGDFDWAKINPILERNQEIEELIRHAKSVEKVDPERAIAEYRQAVYRIKELDSQGKQAQLWRSVRFPINRLSLMLERTNQYEAALKAIQSYEDYSDQLGLTKADFESVNKRKKRLDSKLRNKS